MRKNSSVRLRIESGVRRKSRSRPRKGKASADKSRLAARTRPRTMVT